MCAGARNSRTDGALVRDLVCQTLSVIRRVIGPETWPVKLSVPQCRLDVSCRRRALPFIAPFQVVSLFPITYEKMHLFIAERLTVCKKSTALNWGEEVSKPVNIVSRKPSDVDRIVGQTVKRFRCHRSMTQPELGKLIGKSFKQIRKYEMGENRISASVLCQIAQSLEIEVDDLFQDLPTPSAAEFIGKTLEVEELTKAFHGISNSAHRRTFLAMVKEYADSPLNKDTV